MAQAPSATSHETRFGDAFPGLVHVARWAAAVVMAAVLATGFWLFLMQEGHTGRIFSHSWTDHDFPDGLGNALGAHDPARTGLVATFLLAIGVTLLFALLERRLPGRGWVKGIAFAPAILLLWGLVFCPLVNARQILQADGAYVYLPSGVFGSGSGIGALLSALGASVVTGIVLARGLQLCRSKTWWSPADTSRDFIVDRGSGTLLEIPGTDATAHAEPGLLELAEERPEQRSERPR